MKSMIGFWSLGGSGKWPAPAGEEVGGLPTTGTGTVKAEVRMKKLALH
jgi:hypothetical protein